MYGLWKENEMAMLQHNVYVRFDGDQLMFDVDHVRYKQQDHLVEEHQLYGMHSIEKY